MQGAPDHPKTFALKPGWSSKKMFHGLHHKWKGAADTSRVGFRKMHGPGEQETTEENREKKEREAEKLYMGHVFREPRCASSCLPLQV